MSLPLIQTVPLIPPTQNELLRMHWGKKSRIANDWWLVIPNCPKVNRSEAKRRVEITFVKTKGPLSDPDNLTARAKIPLDALVKRGWLHDDSPAYLDLHVAEVIGDCKTASTVVAVSEINEQEVAA